MKIEKLNEEDPEVHAFLQRQWYRIRSFSRRGRVQDVYNFYYDRNLKEMINNITNSIMENQRNRFKLNYSLGFLLRNITTRKFRYFPPSSNNAQLLDTAILISNKHELVEFLQSIAEENFLIKLCKPDTSWKNFQITNITFYAYKLNDTPLGTHVELPDFLKHNRGVVNVSEDRKLIFFSMSSKV